MVESQTSNPVVRGSNPIGPSYEKILKKKEKLEATCIHGDLCVSHAKLSGSEVKSWTENSRVWGSSPIVLRFLEKKL